MSTEETPPPKQPSSEIQQNIKGNYNQTLGEMYGGNAFGTVEGSISIIYNYYYPREYVDSESIEFTDVPNENLPCPYRGLFNFGPDDAEYFFGREKFIEELFKATQKHNFIPVLGASGSGKSSVVLAGLVPKLQKEGHWLFTHFRPGSDPFFALAQALVPLYTRGDSTTQIAQARALARHFHNDKVTLPDVLSHIQREHPNHRVLLIADQFEELYTLCGQQKIRRSFLDTLLTSFQSSPSQSRYNHVLVATMRADFLGNVLSYRPLTDVLKNADIKLGPMNREELSQVIVKPADKLKVSFEVGLVKRILDDVDSEPGNLPLLEFALTQLWKRLRGKQLTHAAYEEIGEVKGALARHADEKYGNFTDEQKEKVRRIFIQLVHPGKATEDTRRLAKKAELGEASWGLVKQLADARLVVTSRNAENQQTVEVVHEALIKNWGKLQTWMDKDRGFRTWQEFIRTRMDQWEQDQRDEGGLLRGAALADAQVKLERYQEDISKDEQDFINDSVALSSREKKQRSRIKQLIISTLIGGLGLAVMGWRDAAISEIKSLASSSDGFLNSDGPKAVKSSIKAAVKMQGLWGGVDGNIRNQVELSLLNTVHNVALPNTFGGHAKEINGVSFRPDGKMLASVSDDKTVKLWDTETGKVIKTLSGHTDLVWGVSFRPDEKMLASASGDKTVKLWDTNTGKVIATLIGHKSQVNKVRFSPRQRN